MALIAVLARARVRARYAGGPASAPRRHRHAGRDRDWRAARDPRLPSSACRPPALCRDQHCPDDPEPRAVRVPAAAAAHRRTRDAHRAGGADSVRRAAGVSRHRVGTAGHRCAAHRRGEGDGPHRRAAAATRGAAARPALDRQRPPGVDGDRCRHGHDCRRHRRRRPRRVHLSRLVDGRPDGHPRRRHSGGGAGAHRRRPAGARGASDSTPAPAQRRPPPHADHRRRHPRRWWGDRGARVDHGAYTDDCRRLEELHRTDPARRARGAGDRTDDEPARRSAAQSRRHRGLRFSVAQRRSGRLRRVPRARR